MLAADFEPKEPPFLSKDVQAKLERFISLMKEQAPSISEFTLLNGPIELASADELFAELTEKDGYGSTLGHYAANDSACLQTYLNCLTTSVTSGRLDKAALPAMLTEKNSDGSTLGHYAAYDSACLQTYLNWLTTSVANGWLDKPTLLTVTTEKDSDGKTLGQRAAWDSACLKTYLDWLTTSVTSDRLDKAALLTVLTEKDGYGKTLGHSATDDSAGLQTYLNWLTTLVANRTLDKATLVAVLTEKDAYGSTLGRYATWDSACLQTYLKWLTTSVISGVLDNAALLTVFTEKNADDSSKRLPTFGLLRALIETSTDVESTCTALTLGRERLIRTDANDTAAIQFLAGALQSGHCLDHLKLDLRNINLNMAEVRLLLTALQSLQCPPFLELDLSANPNIPATLQTQIEKLLNKKQLHATQRACLMFLRGFADGQNPLAQLDFDVTEVILTNLFQSMGLAERDAKNQAKMAEKPFTSMIRIQESRCHAKAVQDGEKEARRQGLHLANVGFYARSIGEKDKAPQADLPRQALPALITSRLKPSNGLLVIDCYLVDDVKFSAQGMEVHFHSELGAKQFKEEFPKYFTHGSLMEAKCITLPTAALINRFIEKECKLDPEKVYNPENIASTAKAPGI